jgi:polyphenol oxidase
MRATWRAFPDEQGFQAGAMLRVQQAGLGAAFTNRSGGCSSSDLTSLNLSLKANDPDHNVLANRERVLTSLGSAKAAWVQGEQVHGNQVAVVQNEPDGLVGGVDALITDTPGLALSVLVADCVPVLLLNLDDRRLGVAHAGWRGLVAGVLANTVKLMGSGRIAAYIGPSIGPCCFEVGPEVAEEILSWSGTKDVILETQSNPHADLWRATSRALVQAGVTDIGLAAACTRCEPHRYFSHRAGSLGRQALVAALS